MRSVRAHEVRRPRHPAAEGLGRRRFTVAEVEAMVAAGVMEEDERVELIGGELVPMSPKGNQHEVVKVAVLDSWYRIRPDDCRLIRKRRSRLSGYLSGA